MNKKNESQLGLSAEDRLVLLAALPENEIHVIPFADDWEGDEPDAV